MANMKMLIRIVFVIFIANRIDCLGGVCDNWCNCFKEGIKEDENNTAKSLVNTGWYNAKKENLVLKIFKKEDDNDNILIMIIFLHLKIINIKFQLNLMKIIILK